jgi:hypothetical protein
VTVSALGVGRCIPFTVYNHCRISLGTLQLHSHRYSLSKCIEFVNFMSSDVWLLDRVCLLARFHVLVYPSQVFPFVVEVGCSGIASGP